MSQESERNRVRKGVAILVIGIVLILWAWGNWVYRASTPDTNARVASSYVDGPDEARSKAAMYLPQILAYGLVLALVALFGGYAVIRLSRRIREDGERKRIVASMSQDVLAQHKVPDYLGDDESPEQREPQ